MLANRIIESQWTLNGIENRGIYLGAQYRLKNLIPRIITYWNRLFTWMLVVYKVQIQVL